MNLEVPIPPGLLEEGALGDVLPRSDLVVLSIAISLKRIADHAYQPLPDRLATRLSHRMRKVLREIAIGGTGGRALELNALNATARALEERGLIKRAAEQPGQGTIAWQCTLDGFTENARWGIGQ